MNKRLKYLFLLPMTMVVSCGYSTSYLVEGDQYVSKYFEKNYYTHWDSELQSAKKLDPINVNDSKVVVPIFYSSGNPYEFKNLDGLGKIDPNYFDNAPDVDTYGEQFKMGDIDDSFRYGYQSKLFDGQMVCGGQNGRDEYAQAKGRVQIKESGFSVRFSKESSKLHYFAMQFKASTDNTVPCYLEGGDVKAKQADELLFHESTIQLTITIYAKNGTSIVAQPFIVDVDLTGEFIHGDIKNEKGEIVGYKYWKKTNCGHFYNFLAFDVQNYQYMNRVVGVSVEYTVTQDNLVAYNKTKGVDVPYAMFLYEIFFPYTSWN